MIICNLKLLENKKTSNFFKCYLEKSVVNKRFQFFFTGRIFLETVLNKKIYFILLLKEFFFLKKFHFNNFYFIRVNFRKIFSIINSLVQCDIFSFHNFFHIIKYRKKEYFENLFRILLKNSKINFNINFLHKMVIGKPFFEFFNFLHFLPRSFIKIDCFNYLTINLMKINNSIKKNIIKFIITGKQNFEATFKNNGILFEFFLNLKILDNISQCSLNCFYTNPSFLVLTGLHKENLSSFFYRFSLSFLFALESLFLFFLNKERVKIEVSNSYNHSNCLIQHKFKSVTNFFNKLTQSITNLSIRKNILSLIIYRSYINDFDYLKFFIQNSKHFLLKFSISKIKFHLFYSKF
nr:hypothetical protein CcurKRNrm2_p103 [Cryptomonas curvata]